MADTRRWVWLGGIVLLCGFVFLLHSILTPFLVALLLAYLFDPWWIAWKKPVCRVLWAWSRCSHCSR